MNRFLRPTGSKVSIALGLSLVSFGAAAMTYALVDDVATARVLFFPVWVHQTLYPLLREPGVQNVMYGDCLLPYCDVVGFAITTVVSGTVYYLLAAAIDRLRTG